MMGWEKGHEILLALTISGGFRPAAMVRLLRSLSLDDIAARGLDGLVRDLCLAEDDACAARGANAAAIRASMERIGVGILALCQTGYPRLLKEIPTPPPLVFFRGALAGSDSRAVAVVGSRRPTMAGLRIARAVAGGLAAAGFTVVSGLARGIDTAAHRGALEAGGRTIAVLGSGIDVVYPPENRELAELIIRAGAIISELVPGSRPLRLNFPRRNRLVSGLSLGTVVIEAGERSGALITAGLALEQNRTVFAVPGAPGFARSRGANRLIKEGACLVESAEDVVRELSPQIGDRQRQLDLDPLPDLTEEEEQVIALLSDAPAHVDEVSRHLGVETRTVLSLLLSLETRGLVRSLPGKFYVREEVL
jgi:DNA processing protein